jgi:hypothetical protein
VTKGQQGAAPFFNSKRNAMDELRKLIGQYDPYYEMADAFKTYRRGANIDSRIRALVEQLRAQGRGGEIDALAVEYPGLISSPGGMHALV